MLKAILVTTQHRGVFYGEVPPETDLTQRTLALQNARCAIRWNTTNGVAELAEKGPNSDSKIGSKANIDALHDITAVWAVTDEAREKWNSL